MSANSLQRFEAVEPHMGTLVGITLYTRTPAQAKDAFEKAYARIAALNKIFSDYDPSSELNAIGTTPKTVSPELYSVLKFARQLGVDSGGAFDVTIGPLTKLWRARVPLTEAALQLVNWQNLHLESGKAWLAIPGMQLDLGAIGKGYAADEMLRMLKSLNINKALIAASGDIVCGDAPPATNGWQVATRNKRLTLRHAALSTSGDTTQFFERDGQRFSHILDPRTGASLTTNLEVSVVAKTGIIADALATTVRILGAENAENLLRKYHAHIP